MSHVGTLDVSTPVWLGSLQETVKDLVDELLRLLSTGEARMSFKTNISHTFAQSVRRLAKQSRHWSVQSLDSKPWGSISSVSSNPGKLDDLPQVLVPWLFCTKPLRPCFCPCIAPRLNIQDLAHRLRSEGNTWGATRVLERWSWQQPWSHLAIFNLPAFTSLMFQPRAGKKMPRPFPFTVKSDAQLNLPVLHYVNRCFLIRS